eukprot:5993414-Pyramimonas_sp.AAC.2
MTGTDDATGDPGATAGKQGARGACAACGATGRKLLRCGKCRGVSYCGAGCQRKHWSSHKQACGSPVSV